MNKIVFSLFLSSTFYVLSSIPAHAACQPIYGGGLTCEQKGKITIDKTIKRPSDGQFVDTLSSLEPSFAPNNMVEFRIVVKNTETRAVKTITVKDVLPSTLTYVSSPGKFDEGSRTITIDVGELKANESKTYNIQTKTQVVQERKCSANVATVTQGKNTNQDLSEFCIQDGQIPQTNEPETADEIPSTTKGGQPIYQPQPTTQNPETGPEMIPLLALIPSALMGMFLRKKTTNSREQ